MSDGGFVGPGPRAADRGSAAARSRRGTATSGTPLRSSSSRKLDPRILIFSFVVGWITGDTTLYALRKTKGAFTMNNFQSVSGKKSFAPPTIAFVISRTFEDVIHEPSEISDNSKT